MTKKEIFKQFSKENESRLPFSLNYNWWNEVVKEDWEVAVVTNGEFVYGVMPYLIRKKGPWSLIANPHFTPYCGPFLNYPENQNNSTKFGFEHLTYELLLDQLPKFSEYCQNYHLEFNNSLTFVWRGFQNTNRFTYLLNLQPTEDTLWKNLRENHQRQIKKASKKLVIESSDDAELLKRMLGFSFDNKIELDYFQRILTYIKKYNCGQMWVAKEDGNTHAALLSIWDTDTAYYLIGGADKTFRNSGGISLLMWNAIKNAKQLNKKYFNFEGSSIESIEKYLRGFGGELRNFQCLELKPSKSLEIAKKIKNT